MVVQSIFIVSIKGLRRYWLLSVMLSLGWLLQLSILHLSLVLHLAGLSRLGDQIGELRWSDTDHRKVAAANLVVCLLSVLLQPLQSWVIWRWKLYAVIFPHLLSKAIVRTYSIVVYVVRNWLLLVLILFLSLTLKKSVSNLAVVERSIILSPELVLLLLLYPRWSLRSVTSQLGGPLRIWRDQSVIESWLINFTLDAELTALDWV